MTWRCYMPLVLLLIPILMGQEGCENQESVDRYTAMAQQKQYAASQPVPMFDWSLERHLVIQLYQVRNSRVATHAVWRSAMGMIEGDCPSIGFGIPYDMSLTNPLQHWTQGAVIEQAEPNGLFASKVTSATWVMCASAGGLIEPVYVESKVTVYPYPVSVDYAQNRVTKSGASSVAIRPSQEGK